MGRVCDKHGEWCPDGSCRWCEPVAALEPEGLDFTTPSGMFEAFAAGVVRRARETHRLTNRDVCDKCGMSGLAIMQNPHIGCV